MNTFKHFPIDVSLSVTALRAAWAAAYRETGPPTHLFVSPELKPIDPTLLYFIQKEFGLEIEIQIDLKPGEWCIGCYGRKTNAKVYQWGSYEY